MTIWALGCPPVNFAASSAAARWLSALAGRNELLGAGAWTSRSTHAARTGRNNHARTVNHGWRSGNIGLRTLRFLHDERLVVTRVMILESVYLRVPVCYTNENAIIRAGKGRGHSDPAERAGWRRALKEVRETGARQASALACRAQRADPAGRHA